jgi:hypothetical protein
MVHQLESVYHKNRIHIPLLGLASFAVGVARPYGVHGFQLAVFQDVPADAASALKLQPPGPEWTLFLRAVSQRHDGDTRIFARSDGKNIRMLILAIGTNETTLVQTVANPRVFAEQIDRYRHSPAMN